MNPDRKAVLAPEDERLLVAQLAESALAQAAPEELVVFDETAEEYFQDPDACCAREVATKLSDSGSIWRC